MSGTVDPSTPEREARAMLDAIHAEFMSVGRGAGASASTLAQCERDWTQWANAYAAAVRARALADVAGWVEGMRVAQPFVDCPFCTQLHSCANGHYVLSHNVLAYNAALDAVRAKLREAK